MRIFIFTLCLYCGFLHASAETDIIPMEHQSDSYGETSMDMSEGLFFVMGKIKGSRVGYFLVDLGASHTIVKRSAIDKTEPFDTTLVSVGNIPHIMGVQGKINNIIGRTTLEYFKTGKIKITRVPVLIVDSLYDFGDKNVLGILGLDVLTKSPCLRFSMSSGRKAKYKLVMGGCNNADTTEVVSDTLIMENEFIILSGSLNGQPISFILDTGSRYTFITPEAAQRHNITLDSSYITVYQGMEQHPDTAITGHVSNISLGQNRISRVNVLVGNIPQIKGDSYMTGGIVGTDLLCRFRSLEMDFDKRQFRLTP